MLKKIEQEVLYLLLPTFLTILIITHKSSYLLFTTVPKSSKCTHNQLQNMQQTCWFDTVNNVTWKSSRWPTKN